MMNHKVIYLCMFFLPLLTGNLNCQDLFDSLRTIQYANYLYQSGSYREAIDEYERFAFQFSAGDNARHRLVTSYRKAGLAGKAMIRINQLWDTPELVSPVVAKEFFALKIINTDTTNLLQNINNNHFLADADRIFLSSAFLLMNDDYQKAHSILNGNINSSDIVISSFRTLALEGLNLKHKSPALSGTLSAVVPGTGRFYTGQWQDGLMSLIMVGTSLWQSYRGFDRNGINSPYGWIFGTIGTGFYISNITGSIKSANRYNKINAERIRIRVKEVFINNI